jgi:hypothetical protein
MHSLLPDNNIEQAGGPVLKQVTQQRMDTIHNHTLLLTHCSQCITTLTSPPVRTTTQSATVSLRQCSPANGDAGACAATELVTVAIVSDDGLGVKG